MRTLHLGVILAVLLSPALAGAQEPGDAPPAPAPAPAPAASEAPPARSEGAPPSTSEVEANPAPGPATPKEGPATSIAPVGVPAAAPVRLNEKDTQAERTEGRTETQKHEKHETEKKKKKKKKTEYETTLRVISGYEYDKKRSRGAQAPTASDQSEFVLRQARVGFELRRGILKLKLGVEAADGIDPPPAPAARYVRGAYVNMEFMRPLQLRVGRFKKPFSRLWQNSVLELPMWGRGLTHDLVIKEGNYGDRSVGVMLWGKLKPLKLRWSLAATNPSPSEEGVDVTARLDGRVAPWLRLGLDGAMKRTEDPIAPPGPDRPTVTGYGFGGDLEIEAGDVRWVVDATAAQRVRLQDRGTAGGVASFVAYRVPIAEDWRLEPVLFGEWSDAHLEFSGSEALRGTVGLNLLWKKRVRFMPQLERVHTLGTPSAQNPWPTRTRALFTVSAVL